MKRLRVLTPEGLILKALIEEGPLTPTQIIEKTGISRSAVYSNIKDMMLAGWVIEREGKIVVTEAGREAFWSSVTLRKAEVVA